jgi:Flp pilus assembly protein TadD
LLLAITGQGQGSRTASVSPFSHAAVIVDDPSLTEARNTLILAHELAHLFGASHETGSETLMADKPVNETFPPRTVRLIRQLRDYDFTRGVRGLNGRMDRRATDELREELTGLSPEPEMQAHMILAAAMQADGENAQAVPHLQAAVKIDPKNVSARFDLAVALERDGQEDVALETLREGVKLNPGSARLHSALGAVLIKRDREEAIDEFMTSLKLEPNNAPLYATLGDVLSNGMGRVDAAVLAYQDALKLAPGSVQARQGLARTLAAKTQGQAEAVLMRREAAKSPNDPGANYSLGVAEARAGNFDAAVKALERATQLRPKFGQAHVDLALMQYLRLNYAGAWNEVKAARAAGTEPDAVFIQALTRKMPPQ